jgi:cytochrome c-type protein NapC
MITPTMLLAGALAVSALLLVLLIAKPALTRGPGGKILAFVGIVLAPGVAFVGGGVSHLERSKETSFCLSCHVMEPYGKSLRVDDNEYIPAVHYQNNYVPREEACFTCHTDYAMYGTLRAKLRGLRHVAVQYFGTIPDTLALYQPYDNRECLHCHGGARHFLEAESHQAEEGFVPAVTSGKRSCLESGCHDIAHDAKQVDRAELWKETER